MLRECEKWQSDKYQKKIEHKKQKEKKKTIRKPDQFVNVDIEFMCIQNLN